MTDRNPRQRLRKIRTSGYHNASQRKRRVNSSSFLDLCPFLGTFVSRWYRVGNFYLAERYENSRLGDPAITKALWQEVCHSCTLSPSQRETFAGETDHRVKVKQDERCIYPNLKLTIYKTGMRQNRLAKMVGIHEAYLSRIVNGTREPGSELRKSIATALGADADWLFERLKVVAFPNPVLEDRQAS